MANMVISTQRHVNAAGTTFRLRLVEGYGWEVHSVDVQDRDVAFYGGFDRKRDAIAAAEMGEPLKFAD